MKSKKNAIKISVAIIVICFPLYTILQFRLYSDSIRNFFVYILPMRNLSDLRDYVLVICSGALCSGIVSLIIFISEYNTLKLEALENYFFESMNFLSEFRKLDCLVIREPIDLIKGYYWEEEKNKTKNNLNEQLRKSILKENCPENYAELYAKEYKPLKYEEKNKLLNWIWENKGADIKLDYSNLSDKKNYLEQFLNIRIKKYDEDIEKVMKQYMHLRKVNYNNLTCAIGKIDFIFANKKIRRQFLYEKIYKKQIDTLDFIQLESWHFIEYYKRESGNIPVMIEKIKEIQDKIFDITVKEGKYLVNRKFCLNMDNELEDLRKMMYKKSYKEDKINKNDYIYKSGNY